MAMIATRLVGIARKASKAKKAADAVKIKKSKAAKLALDKALSNPESDKGRAEIESYQGKEEELQQQFSKIRNNPNDKEAQRRIQELMEEMQLANPEQYKFTKKHRQKRTRRLRNDMKEPDWRKPPEVSMWSFRRNPALPNDYNIHDLRKQYRRAKRLTTYLQCLEGCCCGLGVADLIGLIPCAPFVFLIPLHAIIDCCWSRTRIALDSRPSNRGLPLYSVLAGNGEPATMTSLQTKSMIFFWHLMTDVLRGFWFPNAIIIPFRFFTACLSRSYFKCCCRGQRPKRPGRTRENDRDLCIVLPPELVKLDGPYQYRREAFAARLAHDAEGNSQAFLKYLTWRDRTLAWRHRGHLLDAPLSQDVHWAREWQFSLQKRIEDQGYRLTNRERLAAPSRKLLICLTFFVLIPALVLVLFGSIYAWVGILGGSITPTALQKVCQDGQELYGPIAAKMCSELAGKLPDESSNVPPVPSSMPSVSVPSSLPTTLVRRRRQT